MFTNEALGEGESTEIRKLTAVSIHANEVLTLGKDSKRLKNISIGEYVRTNFQTALVSVRNPVERIISWFLYSSRLKYREAASETIFGPDCRYNLRNFTSDLSIHQKPFHTKCQKLARSVVLGEVICNHHNSHNFTYY
mmetsp:Transcript_46479/g.68708  ORF Transcript_46479/g.68708 Transcript_46479/m.68708 type:complete len:138 (-) Transcript_46479:356-769(-)